MATYSLITFADLYNAVREELKIQTTDTTSINRIKRDINIVYKEVVAAHPWWWLKGSVDLQTEAYVSAGTIAVAQNSNIATLSIGPASSKTGYKLAIDGFEEIYTIDGHTAASTTVVLDGVYNGPSNPTAGYKIWKNKLPLPSGAKETTNVWQDYTTQPLESLGLQEFRRVTSASPKAEAKPRYYSTGDFVDPLEVSNASIPSLSTRASAGVVKTLVFASAVPATIAAKTRLRITTPGDPSYAGDVYVNSVSTTNVTNDTISYTGRSPLDEAATADATMSVKIVSSETNRSRYRELYLHPALYVSRITLHVDYLKETLDLSADDDEPIMPVDDRSVLLYGALERAWMRERNPEASASNAAKAMQKLAQMAGKLQDTFDSPRLTPSRRYLGAKRTTARGMLGGINAETGGSGGAGSSSSTSGTPNTVAAYNAQGLLGSSTVTEIELEYVQGATSNIQDQIDNLPLDLSGDVSSVGGVSSYNNTVPSTKGGTGQTAYTDGQLLVGNTATGGLSKSTLTAGTGISVTNGNGTITVANTTPAITALTGDVTATGPGSSAATLTATTNATLTTLSSLTAAPSLASVGTVTSGTWSGTTVAVTKGGTGQTAFTNGQLLIGNSSTGGLSKHTLSAGANITITNGNGTITIASTGTGGSSSTTHTYEEQLTFDLFGAYNQTDYESQILSTVTGLPS